MSEDTSELTAELVVEGAVPSQPVISPDGCWVVYVVAPVGRSAERGICAIWLAAADGSSPPRKLTAGTAADFGPHWAPDSASVFFLSDRAGSLQLHQIWLDGAAWAIGQTDRFKAAVMTAGISDWGMLVATGDGGNPRS